LKQYCSIPVAVLNHRLRYLPSVYRRTLRNILGCVRVR